MSNGIRSVVFDFGGVLIDWNPRHLYRKILDGDSDRMEWFLANICTPEWNAMQDAGRTMREASDQLIREHPEHEELILAYYDRWEEMIDGPIDETVEILRTIRNSPYRLYGLTNWSAETFPVAQRRFEFLNLFDGIVVSGDIGMIKPDVAIYHHLIEQFDLTPDETVFIDDSPANVEAARGLGFRAIHFTEPGKLRSDLARHGIMIDSTDQSSSERTS